MLNVKREEIRPYRFLTKSNVKLKTSKGLEILHPLVFAAIQELQAFLANHDSNHYARMQAFEATLGYLSGVDGYWVADFEQLQRAISATYQGNRFELPAVSE